VFLVVHSLAHIADGAGGDVRLNVENEVAAQVAPRGFSGFKMTGAADGESCQEV